ncbi:hypothetical protein [Agrobacterium vitis]|uniref:hypothetical protein n=1 Tax=Agrobacterium vitis TaxID=373 RepID=UPI00203351EB|nr:hypothetical protein [Agrobacterium vitis]MCM2449413.1 hypothetical protein [Agrobacterium vitis]
MTSAVSSQMSMPMMPPMGRMQKPSEEQTTTDATASTSTPASTSTSSEASASAEGTAPEGFEGFEGKFPNFGGGNMGAGAMPPFGQREAFL